MGGFPRRGNRRRLNEPKNISTIMRALIQRVSQASVTIDSEIRGEIGAGFLVLLGIEEADSEEDVGWLAGKVARLRVFDDGEGHMNLGLDDIGGDVLVVSQFTLHANTKKGNRPSFIRAARPEQAVPLYEGFVGELEKLLGRTVATGEFGGDMKVALINDGPVTIWIDSKNRE
jgi:D-tyrosyl-tRNA(Tyr) deacylase